MGKAREAVATLLMSMDKSIRLNEFTHQRYVAAMAAGHAYTNAQDLVAESTEQFRDILYNIESNNTKRVKSPDDVKVLWEEIIGKPWPTSSTPEDPALEDDKDN